MLAQHTGMDGEEIDALLGLFAAGGEDVVIGEFFDGFVDNHLVQRHRAQRDGAMLDEVAAAAIHVAAGGKVHHGVGAVFQGDFELVQFGDVVAVERGGADVGVDFGGDGPADGAGVEPAGQMIAVGGDDQPAGGQLLAHGVGAYRLTFGGATHDIGNLTLAGGL